jgi:alanyl-tRNA synthetase
MSTPNGLPEDLSRPADEVRSSFLAFFRDKGHEVVQSAPLIPANDPTLMFTNAGMVQFKDVFTGKEMRPYRRATSSQKCIRISGKHNDLENVGVTARHHTFFEMLGNFSFGDYFKEEAIAYAWELLTKVWRIPQDRLVITVFGGEEGLPADDEARALWKKITGLADDRIVGMGMKDNFWQMGDTGPCGPCSEIHFFTGESPDVSLLGEEPDASGRGWMEIWNLVFMQFERSLVDGAYKLDKLPAPCVDTGSGLERVASVVQGKLSNYDSDLLRVLVDKASDITGKRYHGSLADDDVSMRVIADHARTTAFLIAEGVFPDRAGREYVLRRVMRRAIRHGHRLGIRAPFLHEVALEVVRVMGKQYPELEARKDLIASVSEQEEVRFRQTIDRGLKILDDEIDTLRGSGGARISGDTAFKLYDTYGFPLDLTEVIAKERGLEVDTGGYEAKLAEQQARSKDSKIGTEKAIEDVWRRALEAVPGGAVRFLGYEREKAEGIVVAIVKNGALVDSAETGDDISFVTDVTPFYGESGGQVGDKGAAAASGVRLLIGDTQKPVTGLFVHEARVSEGTIRKGDKLTLEVDHELRTATRRNHSATHLLHYALRKVLGEQASQKGSLVGPDRLRFDFAYGKAITSDEIARIEDLVNEKIMVDAPVETEVLPIAAARAKGAVAIFEEKYGDVVRVLTMTKDSVELCGGTHARALGEIGLFKILSEGGLAAGVRRIEAATGKNALSYVRSLEKNLRAAAQTLKSTPEAVPERVEKVLEHGRELEKQIADLKRKIAFGGAGGGGGLDDLLRGARDVPGGKALAVRVDAPDAATMREIAEKLRDKLGDAVVLVGAVQGAKAALAMTVSKNLTSKYKAGDLIKPVAEIVGGSGGGRPDMAQAGGTQPEKLDDALGKLYALLS